MQSIEDKVVARIYGHGRGWCFFKIDFIGIGSYELVRKEKMMGLYMMSKHILLIIT